MRGFLHPAVQNNPNETQTTFAGLPRGRRSKLAKEANTTLLKADQWARGGIVGSDVSEALDRAFAARTAKKK